jgi:hypothetical protein
MYNEFEKIWKKAILSLFEVISRHFSGGNEENGDKFLRIDGVRPRLEVSTSRI